MSVEAISWALNLAPVPADCGGQPSSACKFVLVGLANHAGPDGSCAFPSMRTLTRYTALSERTVRACLGRLQAAGLIRPCDPAVVAARIKRADRRPKGWDLDLSLIRVNLAEEDVAALECQFPGLAARLAATTQGPHDNTSDDGVQSPHLVTAVDNLADGVQQSHPVAETGCDGRADGCNLCGHGVQWLHPNRTKNHPGSRPLPPRTRATPRRPGSRATARQPTNSSPLWVLPGG